MNMLTLWYAFVVSVAVVGIVAFVAICRGEPGYEGSAVRRRGSLAVTGLMLVFAIATISWEELALRHFVAEAGGQMTGLIGGPVPYGGGDHKYSPKGQHYERWILQIPLSVGLGTLALIALVGGGLLYSFGYRRSLLWQFLWWFAMSATLVVWSVHRFFDLFEVFI